MSLSCGGKKEKEKLRQKSNDT